MREADIIKATERPLTIDSLCGDFSRLGINKGDVLLVHSSLSSIGWVCVGANAVIEALIRVTGANEVSNTNLATDAGKVAPNAGTLVMPAHSGNLSDPAEWAHPPVPKEWIQTIYDNMPAYDPDITPTNGMGSIPEIFRRFPGVLRSGHPQVSFCAKGRYAREITEGHPLSPQFGMESPLGKMYNSGAKVLLLGVGYDKCTSFHMAEALLDGMPVMRMGTAIQENGARVWKWFDDFAYDSGDFSLIGEAFEKEAAIIRGRVGNADCRLFDMRSGVDFALKWLQENRKHEGTEK